MATQILISQISISADCNLGSATAISQRTSGILQEYFLLAKMDNPKQPLNYQPF